MKCSPFIKNCGNINFYENVGREKWYCAKDEWKPIWRNGNKAPPNIVGINVCVCIFGKRKHVKLPMAAAMIIGMERTWIDNSEWYVPTRTEKKKATTKENWLEQIGVLCIILLVYEKCIKTHTHTHVRGRDKDSIFQRYGARSEKKNNKFIIHILLYKWNKYDKLLAMFTATNLPNAHQPVEIIFLLLLPPLYIFYFYIGLFVVLLPSRTSCDIRMKPTCIQNYLLVGAICYDSSL